MDVTDNENLLLREEENTRHPRRNCNKLRKERCLNSIKKYNLQQRSIGVWNKVSDGVVSAKCVHNFKEKLDKVDMEMGPHECSSGPVNYN